MKFKMIISIINTMDRSSIINALISKGYHATQLNSIGGFTGKENICVIVITAESNVGDVISTVRDNSVSRQVDVPDDRLQSIAQEIDRAELISAKLSGTVISVVDVDQFINISNMTDNNNM